MNLTLKYSKRTIAIFCFLMLLVYAEKKYAQEMDYSLDEGGFEPDNGMLIEDSKIENDKEADFNKMIIDDTISKIGREFSNFFFTNWREPVNQMDYTVIIQEKPLPMNGSQMLVYVDDYLVFQNFVQPRIDVIEDYANYAISMVTTYLNNYELILQQLQGDDLSGSGIY